jgi:hypothetical protein
LAASVDTSATPASPAAVLLAGVAGGVTFPTTSRYVGPGLADVAQIDEMAAVLLLDAKALKALFRSLLAALASEAAFSRCTYESISSAQLFELVSVCRHNSYAILRHTIVTDAILCPQYGNYINLVVYFSNKYNTLALKTYCKTSIRS